MTPWLVDTGILLRMADATDPTYRVVRAAVDAVVSNGISPVCGSQNVAEFWNAATRPAEVRGFGLSIDATRTRLALLEREVEVVAEPPTAYVEWKRLILLHRVSGRQVYDCRLVALMNVYGISDILTLNPADFRRYPDIRVHTPADVVAAA